MHLDNTICEFGSFFEQLTGYIPYEHQRQFAGVPFIDSILSRPTASGKTAEVVVKWLWRIATDRKNTPTRLVYCLPTRALVRQTLCNVDRWVKKSGLDVHIRTLLGGDIDQEWDTNPERPSILIGTQDLLISRALNRGYAMSRYRWPIAFSLLNNDVVWVLDEVQLMGAGLPTTAQLAAFRRMFGTFGPACTIWMSATVDAAHLATPDLKPLLGNIPVHQLHSVSDERLKKRSAARKTLTRAPRAARTPDGLAAFIHEQHRRGAQTLIVVNRVARAIETYSALKKLYKSEDNPPSLLLVHSRFLPSDREAREDALEQAPGPGGRIIISTQVIEAGVDLDSELMVTDLAPYSSMVQRFGRSNRAGALDTSRIYWVDRPLTSKQEKLADAEDIDESQQKAIAAPYEWEELAEAGAILSVLQSASSSDLPPYKGKPGNHHVLRRRDLIDLFDTSRDLAGFDIDISRFVRGGEEHDLFVAWRPAAGDDSGPHPRSRPGSRELCAVPIGEFRSFLTKKKSGRRAWTWDPLDGDWNAISRSDAESNLRPGAVYLIDSKSGGYDAELGWAPDSSQPVPAVDAGDGGETEDQMDEDRLSLGKYAQTLAAHSREVRDHLLSLLKALCLSELDFFTQELLDAALEHDVGKALPVFQKAAGAPDGILLAKGTAIGKYERKHFRHELASALAVLASGSSDLQAYLVAAHHGKVRLAIRSLPGETPPDDPQLPFARGVYDGEQLPRLRIGHIEHPETVLDLSAMQLGGIEAPSWTDRVLRLRDDLGPFRLAFLEMLLRVADWRASEQPVEVLS